MVVDIVFVVLVEALAAFFRQGEGASELQAKRPIRNQRIDARPSLVFSS